MAKSRADADDAARRERFATMCERAIRELEAERAIADPVHHPRLDAEIETLRGLLGQVRP